MKKLFPYLILNIVVSALTMLLVLVIWNKTHPTASTVSLINEISMAATESVTPTISLPALGETVIEIQAVIVPGDLESERVLIRSVSTNSLQLMGWKLSNGKGQEYVFPSLTLFPGGVIALYSKSGDNSALEIYWGLTKAAWKSGSAVTITDSAGNERVKYIIP
jgi:hypothetical protein